MESIRKFNIGKGMMAVAILILALTAYGFIGAAQLNARLSQMGMSFLDIDDALSTIRNLSAYTGTGMKLGGMNALLLFAVENRAMLLMTGAIAMVSGIILNQKNAGEKKDGSGR